MLFTCWLLIPEVFWLPSNMTALEEYVVLASRNLWWEFISICHLVNGGFLSGNTGCSVHSNVTAYSLLLLRQSVTDAVVTATIKQTRYIRHIQQ
jgi:hypothetical protein